MRPQPLATFLFVMMLNPLIPKLRDSVWMSVFLDAVNVASVGLMLATLVTLGISTVVSWPAACIAVLSGVAVFRYKLSPVWVVMGASVLGRLLSPWV